MLAIDHRPFKPAWDRARARLPRAAGHQPANFAGSTPHATLNRAETANQEDAEENGERRADEAAASDSSPTLVPPLHDNQRTDHSGFDQLRRSTSP